MDLQISRWFCEVFGNSKPLAYIARILTYLGDFETILIAVLVLFAFKKTRRLSIYIAAAVGISCLINSFVFKPLIARDRPFVADETLKAVCNLSNYEFPDGYSMLSGHSCGSMSFAVTIILFFKKRWTISVMAYPVVVGFTRLALCVHYFTDVIAGFAFGALVAFGMFYLVKFLDKKFVEYLDKRKKI